MRAVLVSVNYHDILAVTLPYNRHHFDDVLVITDKKLGSDAQVARENGVEVFVTDAFYRKGATFNKFLALEEGLDWYGRYGPLAVMDADVVWPKDLKGWRPEPRMLHTPLRRMWEEPTGVSFPPESEWFRLPFHPNRAEFPGYSQLFYAEDPVLGPPPWHDVTFLHAGAADSFFQAKWPKERKIRPPWECLHIGPAGKNWFGRATPYLDGEVPGDAAKKLATISEMWATRRERRIRGEDPFSEERLT